MCSTLIIIWYNANNNKPKFGPSELCWVSIRTTPRAAVMNVPVICNIYFTRRYTAGWKRKQVVMIASAKDPVCITRNRDVVPAELAKADRSTCLRNSSNLNSAITAPNRKEFVSRMKRDGPAHKCQGVILPLLYKIFLNV
jgi:hypothetical protein